MGEIHIMGRKGEEEAVRYLLRMGARIIEKNYRIARIEVDVIAKIGEFLVFVEVKTRGTDFFGSPEMMVTKAKQKRYKRAAELYTKRYLSVEEIRFDVIGVLFQKGIAYINHIPSAFSIYS